MDEPPKVAQKLQNGPKISSGRTATRDGPIASGSPLGIRRALSSRPFPLPFHTLSTRRPEPGHRVRPSLARGVRLPYPHPVTARPRRAGPVERAAASEARAGRLCEQGPAQHPPLPGTPWRLPGPRGGPLQPVRRRRH